METAPPESESITDMGELWGDMLESLHVKNMALIGEEEITPGSGLNILTGETGAGKSVMIGSVAVALGFGSFKDYLAKEDGPALVELLFSTHSETVTQRLSQLDLAAEDGQIVISRKYQNGRTISRINGETVPIKTVQEIASLLINLHGQQEHQSLLRPSYPRQVLDQYAKGDLGDLKTRCADAARSLRKIREERSRALTDERARQKQMDLLSYEIREIEDAHLVAGEDEELEQTCRKLGSAQKILETLSEASALLEGGDSVEDRIGRCARLLGSVSTYDDALSSLCDAAAQAEDLIADLMRSMTDYQESFSFDEQAYQECTQRLDLINHLKAKYGKGIPQVLSYLEEIRTEYDTLQDYEGYLNRLEQREQEAVRTYRVIAEKISAIRKTHAAALEQEMTASLQDLNFPQIRFEIRFRQLPEGNETGIDEISFYLSTNPGMPLKPVSEVASGGELSRIMLGIKSVLADQDEVETLIFDEIDAGISGRTAQKVSEKMAEIARTHQVICITHLAQIAAMADHHFEIRKEVEDGETHTHITSLSEEDSTRELARILGGVEITDAVWQNAKEMKQLAKARKGR